MLLERIDAEMKDAARAKDSRRLTVLRALKSQLKYREIEVGRALADDDVVAVAQQLIKQRKDAIVEYVKGGRPELADAERAEVALLEPFLPQQLTDAELAGLVGEAVAKSGAKGPRDMGAVMKALMPLIQGRAEGKRVSDAVKAALAASG